MNHFKFYTKEDILSLTRLRRYETKVGERVECIKKDEVWLDKLNQSRARYVIFGIPEDLGVRGNFGHGGADTNWLPFLNEFLNVQHNDFFSAEQVLLLGHFDFGDIKYLIENNAFGFDEKIDAYRHAVNIIDENVEKLVKLISSAGKIPIAISGGHNNAYPMIKGVAKGLKRADKNEHTAVNCINLDAHADYKLMEGRHSGNAFRYAKEEGFLNKYFILGLHENYVSQNVLLDIHEHEDIRYISFEKLFIHEQLNFTQAMAHAVHFMADAYTGIEIDLDAIQNTLCSATTPIGILSLHARQFVNFATMHAKVAYLHICEGACQLVTGEKDNSTGKLISYLVTDFIKGMESNTENRKQHYY